MTIQPAKEQLRDNADYRDFPWKPDELLVPLRTAEDAIDNIHLELSEDLEANCIAVVNMFHADEKRNWEEMNEPEDHIYHALEWMRLHIANKKWEEDAMRQHPDPDYAATQADSYGVDAPNVIDP